MGSRAVQIQHQYRSNISQKWEVPVNCVNFAVVQSDVNFEEKEAEPKFGQKGKFAVLEKKRERSKVDGSLTRPSPNVSRAAQLMDLIGWTEHELCQCFVFCFVFLISSK